MNPIRGAIENTIPISLFNKGLAGKIFEDVRQCGAKVVMKNNSAECVLLSPEQYVRLLDEVNDARLLALASDRMAKYDGPTVSQEDMDREFGFAPGDYEDAEEIDFE